MAYASRPGDGPAGGGAAGCRLPPPALCGSAAPVLLMQLPREVVAAVVHPVTVTSELSSSSSATRSWVLISSLRCCLLSCCRPLLQCVPLLVPFLPPPFRLEDLVYSLAFLSFCSCVACCDTDGETFPVLSEPCRSSSDPVANVSRPLD